MIARTPTWADLFAAFTSLLAIFFGIWLLSTLAFGYFEFVWIIVPGGLLMICVGFVSIREGIAWLNKIPGSLLEVTDKHILIGASPIDFEQVAHIGWRVFVIQKRTRAGPVGTDHAIFATLTIGDGRKFEFGDGQGGGTWWGRDFGKKKTISLLNKLRSIDKKTFDARYEKLAFDMYCLGEIKYDNKRITRKGMVYFGKRPVALKNFMASRDDPFVLTCKAKGIFGRTDKIILYEDKAVFLSLVDKFCGIYWPTFGFE